MSTNLSRSLSLLRQEKGVSQRLAAQELAVSQALLSHYENGLREPGVKFILRACDYYNVSADFLLGRTLSRDGTVILNAEALLGAYKDREQDVGSDALAQLTRTLLVNACDLLLELLGQTRSDDAVRSACHFLGTAIYIMFRHLYQADGKNSQDLFSVSAQKFDLSAATIDMLSSEMEYVVALSTHAKQGGFFPDLTHEALQKDPVLYESLLHIIHITGERISRQMPLGIVDEELGL